MTMNDYRRQAKDLANCLIDLDMKKTLTAASRKIEGVADYPIYRAKESNLRSRNSPWSCCVSAPPFQFGGYWSVLGSYHSRTPDFWDDCAPCACPSWPRGHPTPGQANEARFES